MKLLGYILILAIVLTGCAEPAKDEPVALRLVSGAPSVTEILFALGLEREVVGVSQHCNYPSAARTKAKIGTFSRPNIEKIINLKPDIIFLTGLEQDVVTGQFEKLGIRTVTVYPKDLQELYQSIRYIGQLVGRRAKADSVVANMKEDISNVTERVSKIPSESRKKLLFEIMNDPLIVAGRNSFIGQLGTIAGGINIAYDTERAYSKFSPEIVVERDPDCIILGYMFEEGDATKRIQSRLGWSNINAVKTGAIFNDIDPDILLRPGPRTSLAVEEIYKRLYER
jgi:iron complex transport system substrate-binding protein